MSRHTIAVFGVIVLLFGVVLGGCDNQRARLIGGTMTVELPPNEKLVTVTWKTTDGSHSFWYLTRPMRTGEVPETYKFKEKSTFGLLEGTVIIKERKE